jgi:tetratricopeptide (TPR) repeat protein
LDEPFLLAGRQWLGWVELQRGDLEVAVRDLAGAERSGWSAWAAGKRAMRDRNYREAAARYGEAVQTWETAKAAPVRTLVEQLAPAPDLRAAYVDLGSAQLLAGDWTAAIGSLSRTVKDDPSNARALFLRGRAHELAGHAAESLADYNLASRTAFASAQDLASGEAHLYRGIWAYRRKEFARAEDAFTSALNFAIPETFRGDAAAWRYLAAVAGGACQGSRENLERALFGVSAYFPIEEARARLGACSAITSR